MRAVGPGRLEVEAGSSVRKGDGAQVAERPVGEGDNFRVPGHREPLRYVQQTLTAKDAGAPLEVKFIMEKVEK